MTGENDSGGWPLHYRILLAMVIGTVVGVALNPGEIAISGPVELRIVHDENAILFSEVIPETSKVLYSEKFADAAALAKSYPRLAEALGEKAELTVACDNPRARIVRDRSGVTIVWQRNHDGNPAVSQIAASSGEKLPEFWRLLVSQHPAGVAGGMTIAAKALGDLFLQLLKMVTVPLILTSLVTGVTGLGSRGNFGRMFGRTITYYIVTSMLAITTGLVLVNIIHPGVGAILPGGGAVVEQSEESVVEIVFQQVLRLFPANPIEAIAQGEFLSIISFAILLGIFINFIGGDHGQRLTELFEAAFAVMMRMTSWVISLAPFGVAAFMIFATASQGFDVFRTLAWYMLTVALALAIHAGIILPLIVRFVAKRSPLEFARHMSSALLTAFSTASSNATLPLTISCVEQQAGISNRTSSFVLPLGATINMDGTALYEVVAVLFIAQATPGFEMSITTQVTIALTALIASIGAAGIPHAGLVMMAIVLQAVGLPLEAQGIIIAVDRILDMFRTSVNVWSDSCGCAVVQQLTESSD
ncbi:MAG: dicarboxylate/amino acid:cation symporter [Planctomycetaceae bacterium]